MRQTLGNFISKQCGSFVGWVKLLFADDDDHRIKGAPQIKNVILFVLLILFSIAFLKTVYLMGYAARADIGTSDQNLVYQMQIPDIPSGWQTMFLAGLGIMAAMSGAKKIAEFKYKNGNGNGNEKPPDGEQSDEHQAG